MDQGENAVRSTSARCHGLIVRSPSASWPIKVRSKNGGPFWITTGCVLQKLRPDYTFSHYVRRLVAAVDRPPVPGSTPRRTVKVLPATGASSPLKILPSPAGHGGELRRPDLHGRTGSTSRWRPALAGMHVPSDISPADVAGTSGAAVPLPRGKPAHRALELRGW